jgi:hypothetical protein
MPITPDIPATEAAIIASTNAFRGKHHLPALKPNKQLAAAARAYAKALAKRGDLTHTANGTTPPSRASASGYPPCEIAENLAAIYDSHGFTADEYAKRAVSGWENSPPHRENLLRPGVTDTGIGVAKGGDNDPRYVAVQLLGRPSQMQYSFRIVNRSGDLVGYTFGGKSQTVAPRQVITHTSCAGGPISFLLGAKVARYEARNGQVYTLKGDGSGGVRLDIEKGALEP